MIWEGMVTTTRCYPCDAFSECNINRPQVVPQHRERNLQESREPYASRGGEVAGCTRPECFDIFWCVYEGKVLNVGTRGTFNRSQPFGFSPRPNNDVPTMDIYFGKHAVIGDEQLEFFH